MGMCVSGCHKCARGRGGWCVACKRVNQDDIRIQHTPHDRDELTATACAPPTPRLNLTADAEDAVRRLLAELAALSSDEREILFRLLAGATIADVARERGVCRQTTFYQWKKACRNHPVLARFAGAR